jgi:hypothetical protein
MVVVLYLIALVMIGAGAAAIAYGWGIVLNERGWSMVISGSVVLSGGCVLLGIAVIAWRVRKVQRELAAFREGLARLGPGLPTRPVLPLGEAVPAAVPPPAAKPAVVRDEPEEHAVLKAADAIPEPAPAVPAAAPVRAPAGVPEKATDPSRTVIGTYSSGGNGYVMYSDGSIEADTPNGRFTFQSLDELKDFIASGGEQPARAS